VIEFELIGISRKILKYTRHCWIEHISRHNEIVVNSFEKPQLTYLKQVASNTGAESYTAMKGMVCSNSGNNTANQSKDCRLRRRKRRRRSIIRLC
jgi:hypothetical protein